eukprot:3689863-Pleurochrysis_carterae.AAC.1
MERVGSGGRARGGKRKVEWDGACGRWREGEDREEGGRMEWSVWEVEGERREGRGRSNGMERVG